MFKVGDSVKIKFSGEVYRPGIVVIIEALVNSETKETIYSYVVEIVGGLRYKVAETELSK